MAGVRFSDVQSRPMEFLDLTVACLLTAGNVLGPLPIRLKGRYQPVISTQNAFSTPPPSLLSGI